MSSMKTVTNLSNSNLPSLEWSCSRTLSGDKHDPPGLSSNKYWILGVDQINRRSLGLDNDSSLSAYLTHGIDNSFISDGSNRYGARATGEAPGINSIWNSTGRTGGRPGKSSGNTLGKSQTIGTSLSFFPSDLSSSFLADIYAKKIWHPFAMYS
ncbi:hypothetical protein Tco_1515563 [Tanacetum coccineum]